MRLTSDGRRLPLPAGTQLKNYRIEAVQSLYDRSFYLAQDSLGEVVLAESPAFFSGPVQDRVWAAAKPAMLAQGLELLDGFQAAWQGVAFNYSVYPRWLWDALDENLRPVTGDQSAIRKLYNWLRSQQQLLAETGWVNPSLALPWLLERGDGSLIQLEWEYCVPLDGTLDYPRFLVGYHHASAGRLQPARLAWTAAYASLLALLQGQPPQLWAPQLVSWRSIRPLLSRDMRDWLQNWPQQALAQDWPDLPERLYRPGADLEAYTRAGQACARARSALAAGDARAALSAAGESGLLYLNDPWPAYLTAQALIALNQPEAAAEALEAAWRLEPLAAVAKAGARLALDFPEAGLSAAAAAERLASLLANLPQDDEAWALQSRLAARSGQLATAEACLQRACRLRPLNPDYRRALSELRGAPLTPVSSQTRQTRQIRVQAELSASSAASPASPAIPAQLGRWRLESCLREPGLHPAGLWRGHEPSSGRQVLLKLFALADPAAREAWRREASCAGRLHHPALLRPLAAEAASEELGLIAYPWHDAPSCEQLLRQGPLPAADVMAIGAQLESVLSALQSERLSHGDLAPSNLLWRQGRVKLIDFDNLGPADQPLALNRSQPAYTAPERRTGMAGDDRYSLAVSLLHLASGLFPDLLRSWRGRDYSGIRPYLPHLPAEWVEAVLAASRWDARRRRVLQLPSSGGRPVPAWLSDLARAVNILAEADSPASALAAREQLLSCERSAVSLYHAAFHALRLGLREQAVSDARTCLQADPEHLGALWILAELQLGHQAHEDAASTLQRALNIDPDAPESYQLLIRLYADAGSFMPAWSACEQLSRCLPLSAEADAARFSLLWRFGCYSQARALGHKLLESHLEPERKAFIRKRLSSARMPSRTF